MKILHLIYTNGVSGAEKHLLNLLPGLKLKGFDCHLIIVCPPAFYKNLKDFAQEFIENNIQTEVIASKKNLSFKTLQLINRYLNRHNIPILHSHLVRSDIMAALIKEFFNRKLFLISTKHGYQEKVMCNYIKKDFKIPKNLLYYVTKYVLHKTNVNLAVSKYIADFFINLKFTTASFPVVHHGIDIPYKLFQDKKNNGCEIIIIGRLEILKGQFYVIEALPQILKHFPECKLTLVGNGSYEDKLEKLVQKLNLGDKVSFLGFQKDPYEFIANADIILIPSLAEAFGLVFLEAMAIGTPIIAFDVPAGNEILINGKTGLLVPVGDVKAIAEKCISLFSNVEERNKLAYNAHQDYLQNYTKQAMVNNTEIFLKSLTIPSK